MAAILLVLPFSTQAQGLRGVTISYLPDPGLALTIESASSLEKAGEYLPYVPSFMAFSRLPDTFNGAVWLRMAFAPSFNAPEGEARISFGLSLPGTTRLFIPQQNGSFAVKSSPAPRGVFTLPGDSPFPDILYARIDGAPSLWFRPVIEQAEEAPHDIPLHLILVGILGLAMLVMLAQYIRKAEEWRLWAAITAGCGIVAALAPPLPAAGQAFTPLVAATLLMPGMILVFFSHMTRHLLSSPKTMPGYDRLLAFYYLFGGAIALLPLVPGFLWTARYLPFAWLALLPFLPLGMVALSRSLKGAGALFCAALLSIAGVAVSAWELTAPGTPYLDGAGGLLGLALGMVLLSFTGPAKAREESRADDDVFASLDRACPFPGEPAETQPAPEPKAAGMEMPLEWRSSTDTSPEQPLPGGETEETPPEEQTRQDYPDLAIFKSGPDETPAGGDYPELSLFEATEEETQPEPEAQPVAAPEETAQEEIAPEPREEVPAPAAATLEPVPAETPEPALPPVAAASPAPLPVDEPVVPAPVVPFLPGTPITIEDETPLPSEDDAPVSGESPAHAHADAEDIERKSLFDLPLLIKETYDSIAPLAEQKNIGLTWFIAPQTGRLFEGEARLLKSALRLILRDMAEALDKGNVRLTVRRLPDSLEAGHLVFTIVEWDGKLTASLRNMAGLAEAWALAEKTGGIFSVEHSPSGGTTVIFSAMFAAMDKPKPAPEDEAPAAAPEEPAEAALADAPAPLAAKDAKQVQVFVDHPDIAMPADFEPVPQAHVPAGLDGDELAEESDTERSSLRVIIVDTTASGRHRTAAMFAETPYSVLECASPDAAVALYARHPAALLLMNADMPEADIASAVKAIRADDEAAGRSPVMLVTIVEHEQQAERLTRGGSDMTLMKPVTREALLEAVSALLPRETPAVPANLAEAAPVAAPEKTVTPEKIEAGPHAPEIAVPPAPDAAPEKTEPERSIEASGIFSTALPPEKDADNAEQHTVKRSSGPELALLDMIITDEDSEPAPEQPARPVAKASVTSASAKRTAPKAARVTVVAPPVKAAPKHPEAETQLPAKTEDPAAGTGPAVMVAAPGSETAPEVKPEPARKRKVTAKPEFAPETEIDLASPILEKAVANTARAPLADTLVEALQPDDGSKFRGAPSGSLTSPDISVPLPGEDDSVFKDMLPLVPGLIHELSDAMHDAAKGREEKSPMLVQEAAERIAGKAESFGLTKLERMARCVERAAAADDIEPMECVLADLESWVARYKEALQKLHREMRW